MSKLKSKRNILIALIFSLISATEAFAQTTEFTYQGKINDAGGQAAAYDFVFRLCASETASCVVPLAVSSQSGISVPSSGTFTVKLDFGAVNFDGADKFMEISVRRANTGNFVTLAPRQKLTSVPYAIQTLKANDASNLGGTAANQYVLTTDPRLSATNYVQNGTTAQTGVNFNVGGTGTASIFNAETQFDLGGSRILSNQGQYNLFAGIDSGNVTTGGANAFFGGTAGKMNTTGNNNSFFGAFSGSVNTSGGFNSFFGASAGEENSTGASNSFFGQSAGGDTTSGNFNSFVGQSAGFNSRTGSNNSALGANTAFSVNNLSFATAIGAGATVGTSNTLVLGRPSDAVQAPGSLDVGSFINTETQYNIGGNRYFSNGGAASNVYVGANSQCGTANGSDSVSNTFVGYYAALNCTVGSGNTVVGTFAGNVRDGDNNTLIGSSAKITDNSGTIYTSTAIGALARVSKSNTLVLGIPSTNNVIKGNLQVYAGREEPGGPGTSPAFESVTTTTYGPGLAASRLYLSTIANPVYTQSPICFAASSGGQIPYGIVGYCANGTGRSELKTDVKPFEGGLQIVKRLKPVAFRWKENGESAIGLNADEVAAVDTNLVSRDEKGEISKVDENTLNAILINAVKQQQAQIETQAKQIEQLKKLVCATNAAAEICKEEK